MVFAATVPQLPSLKRIREAHFLTQDELAQRSGLHRVTLARLEAGRAVARFGTLRKLAQALDVQPQDLIKPAPAD
jgi:transcriptional regulator with XRE-family HTH domain